MFHNFFNNNGSIKEWHKFKREYNPHHNSYFQWVQLIGSILGKWKFIIKNNVAANLITHGHHLNKGSRFITSDELRPIEIYSTLILKVQNKLSSDIYFKNLFNYNDIDWTAI